MSVQSGIIIHVYMDIPNGDDLLLVFIMLSYVCCVIMFFVVGSMPLCVAHFYVLLLIIFEDIARLSFLEHRVCTHRLCILITASHKYNMVKPNKYSI